MSTQAQQTHQTNSKVIVITGASSGIGEATARVLAQAGHKVVLGARRTERLETLTQTIREAGGQAIYQSVDVTKRDQVQDLVNSAREHFGRVDVLINNAGIMPLANIELDKVEEWDRMIDVNIKGVLYGISAVLPVMREQKQGQIINISSIGAYAVSPSAAVYCATKYAVRAISDGLRQEMTDGEIRVTNIAPGITESELADIISDDETRELWQDIRSRAYLPAEAIAKAMLYAIEQPQNVDVNEIVVRPTASAF